MMVRRRLAFVRARSIVLAVMLSMLAVSPLLAQGEEVNELIQQLKSPDAFMRLAAAGKVAELGPASADAAPALIEALKCERIDVLFEPPPIAASRRRFSEALIRIGDTAAPHLENALEHENGLVRIWSAHSLHGIDRKRQRSKVLEVLIDALRQGNEVAGDAALVLELMGEDAVLAIPALIEQLGHRELTVRCNVAHALAALAKEDSDRQLIEALRHTKTIVRVGAAFALHLADSVSSEDVHSIIAAALQDDSGDVRRQAVWAIGQMGVAAQQLAKELINALPKLDPDPGEYFFGGSSLGRQSTDPSMVLVATGPVSKSALIDALDGDNPRSRVMVAVALLRLDQNQAARVAPILKAAHEDSDQNIRFLADMNYSLAERVDSQDLDGLIRELLKGNDFGPPSPAAVELIQRGAECVGPLMEVLKGGDGLAARQAGNVLAGIGAPALPALTDAMDSENDQLRVFAIAALAGMGEPALPLLVKALKDDLYPVRRAARYALRAVGTPASLDALRKSEGHP